MAHIEKFQSGALGNMCDHYERKAEIERGYKRENIDPERTALNYNLRPREVAPVDFINARIASLNLKRAPRKDAVRMIDTVVSCPVEFDGDEDELMRAVVDFLDETFGAENCVSAWVHKDEKETHVHYACVPVTSDGRLSAKDLLARSFLNRFHDSLEAGVCRRLGVDHVGLKLDDDQRAARKEKAAKYVKQPEYIDACEALEDKLLELEDVKRDIENQKAQLDAIRDDCDAESQRLESLRRATDGAKEVIRQMRKVEKDSFTEPETLSAVLQPDNRGTDGAGRMSALRERISRLESDLSFYRDSVIGYFREWGEVASFHNATDAVRRCFAKVNETLGRVVAIIAQPPRVRSLGEVARDASAQAETLSRSQPRYDRGRFEGR